MTNSCDEQGAYHHNAVTAAGSLMSSTPVPHMLVATDLDGTLLDHDSYRWDLAVPALDRLRAHGIPVIFNTSKTFEEVTALQADIGVRGPFIVENGSALFLPTRSYAHLADDAATVSSRTGRYCTILFGAERADILQCIHALRREHGYRFEGFDDWSVEQIAAHTCLELPAARRAASKQFSEPILWQDSDDRFEAFSADVAQHGYLLLKGGRLHHVQGQTDKARPLQWLQQQYLKVTGEQPLLVCLGDTDNDIAMLNAADYPVCVKSPVAPYPEVTSGKAVIKTRAFGPEGWGEAINRILKLTG